MDRKKYLELCQRVSCLADGVLGIKKDVPEELTVVVDGMRYYPVEYILSYSEGVARHYAVLHDLEANSVRREELDRVLLFEEGECDANKGD